MNKPGTMKYARRMTAEDWANDPQGRTKETAGQGVYVWTDQWVGPFRCSIDAMTTFKNWIYERRKKK